MTKREESDVEMEVSDGSEVENECDEDVDSVKETSDCPKSDEELKNEASTSRTSKNIKKKPKRGIIYLSTIPPFMNVTKIREVFGEFGKVGRVFLQMDELNDTDGKPKMKSKKSKKRIGKKFTEGWVEYEKKSIAKKVAERINNTQVSTRKKSKHYDVMWNIKYLSNFKWAHLHERLTLEKEAMRRKQKLEVEQAKKKTNLFTANLDKHKKKMTFTSTGSKNEERNGSKTSSGNGFEHKKHFVESLFN